MAKKTVVKDEDQGTDGKPGKKLPHHKEMLASGAMLVFSSRPRGRPYQIEEWLNASRRYQLVKAYDNGQVVRFDEAASYADPKAAAEGIR